MKHKLACLATMLAASIAHAQRPASRRHSRNRASRPRRHRRGHRHLRDHRSGARHADRAGAHRGEERPQLQSFENERLRTEAKRHHNCSRERTTLKQRQARQSRSNVTISGAARNANIPCDEHSTICRTCTGQLVPLARDRRNHLVTGGGAIDRQERDQRIKQMPRRVTGRQPQISCSSATPASTAAASRRGPGSPSVIAKSSTASRSISRSRSWSRTTPSSRTA